MDHNGKVVNLMTAGPVTASTHFRLDPGAAEHLQAIEADPARGYKGKLNIYRCRKCRGHIVTRDLDHGVTPFMTSCHATPDCTGLMQSSMYRVFDQEIRASHVWYRPEQGERLFSGGELQHLQSGGLLLRKAKIGEG